MIIEDGFDVEAPLAQVWPVLKDVPRVAGCIPNARITEVVDERTYKTAVAVKAGPVSVSYNATVIVESIDDTTHEARLRVEGAEARGRGGVSATVTTRARDDGGKTHVDLHTDAKISGIIATVGGRLIEGVAKKTLADFAKNLAAIV